MKNIIAILLAVSWLVLFFHAMRIVHKAWNDPKMPAPLKLTLTLMLTSSVLLLLIGLLVA